MCLDADEWLDEAAREAVRGILEKDPGQAVCGLWLKRSTFYLGRWVSHGPWAGEKKLRLVRRGCARWERTKVHESLLLLRGEAQGLRGHIRHQPYESLGHQLAKLDRYSDLIAERDAEISRWRALYGVALEPWLVFLHRYFIQLGFLDGLQGFVGSAMNGYDFFLRYAKILLHRTAP